MSDGSFNGYHFDELWWGSDRELRTLLDRGYLGDYQAAPVAEGGGVWMECPIEPSGGHYVRALERRPEHVEFTCSGGCADSAIRAKLLDVQALIAGKAIEAEPSVNGTVPVSPTSNGVPAPRLRRLDLACMVTALDPLHNLVRRFGAGGLLLHHSGRSSGAYRGSSAIGASTELGFKLGRSEDDSDRARRYLETWKCRPAPEPPRFQSSCCGPLDQEDRAEPSVGAQTACAAKIALQAKGGRPRQPRRARRAPSSSPPRA